MVMRLDYLKGKQHVLPVALFGVAVLMGVLVLAKVADLFISSARADGLLRRAATQDRTDPNNIEKHVAKAKAIADGLKKKNLFAPPAPRRNPVTAVLGILGNDALINNNWHKEGDKIADAELVAVEPTQVKVKWDGRETVFAPISSAGQDGPGGPGGPGRGPRGEGGPPGAPMMSVGGPGGPEGFGGRFGNLSEEERARMRERFAGMRERFMNMSPEERRAAMERARGQFGGPGGGERGPGGRGGRRGR